MNSDNNCSCKQRSYYQPASCLAFLLCYNSEPSVNEAETRDTFTGAFNHTSDSI